MEEKIVEIFKGICCEEVKIDGELIKSGILDSYKIMELVCCLEEEFQVSFLPEDITNLNNFSCVECIAGVVRSRMV